MSKTNKKTQKNQPKQGNSKNKQKARKQTNSNPQGIKPGKLSSAPVSTGRVNTTRKPNMRTKPNGDCIIRHREYIQEINAGGSSPSVFTAQQLSIQPGASASFPWLSQIATRFEKYQFKMLKFIFETEAPTALGGSLMLTVDYDASDPAPISKVQAMAYENAVRSPPWQECEHRSRVMDISNQKGYYIRDSALGANQDIKLYDTGNLFICSQNVATAGSLLGELYVEYEIHLMTPQLPSAPVASTLSGTAGTAASIVTTGQVITGNLITSQVGNLVSLTNLIVGQKYLLQSLCSTVSAGSVGVPSAPVGMTLNNALSSNGSVISAGQYTATASAGSITLTSGGNATNVVFSIIPVVLGF
jgi:hypothetical protein